MPAKPVIYIAHPVSGDVVANLERAVRWTKALLEHDSSRIYIAPWIGEVTAYLGGFPEGGYDRVLDDDCRVVEQLHGLIAVGGTWSRGMKLESKRAADVWDWSQYREPTEVPEAEWDALRSSDFGYFVLAPNERLNNAPGLHPTHNPLDSEEIPF